MGFKNRKPKNNMSLSRAIYQILEEAGGPLTLSEMIDRVKKIYNFGEGNPGKKIRSALSYNSYVERVARGTYDLMEHCLRGARFRYRPSELELTQGCLNVENEMLFIFCFDLLSRQKTFEDIKFTILDSEDRRVPVYPASIDVEVPRRYLLCQFRNVSTWFEKTDFCYGDDLLITVVDAPKNIFRWEKVPREQRKEEEIKKINKKLADLACSAVNRINSKETSLFELMKKMAALFNYREEYTPDELSRVLQRDGRLVEFQPGRVSLVAQEEKQFLQKQGTVFLDELGEEECRELLYEELCSWLLDKGEKDIQIHLDHVNMLLDYLKEFEAKPIWFITESELKFFMYSYFPRRMRNRKPEILPSSLELFFTFLWETIDLEQYFDLEAVFKDEERFMYRLDTFRALDPGSPKWDEKYAQWCQELEKWIPEWFTSKEKK